MLSQLLNKSWYLPLFLIGCAGVQMLYDPAKSWIKWKTDDAKKAKRRSQLLGAFLVGISAVGIIALYILRHRATYL